MHSNRQRGVASLRRSFRRMPSRRVCAERNVSEIELAALDDGREYKETR